MLYGIHSGAIPGPWNPTNRGVDPYIASRGEEGWSTTYAGIQADNPFAASPFASDLDEASPTLASIAFGGRRDLLTLFRRRIDRASPCVRPTATSSRAWRVPRNRVPPRYQMVLSGSDSRLTAPTSSSARPRSSQKGGTTEPGTSRSTIAISRPGRPRLCQRIPPAIPSPACRGQGSATRPVTLQESPSSMCRAMDLASWWVSSFDTDAAGNQYFHLYMHIGTQPGTVDLTPGTVHGALYRRDDGGRESPSTSRPVIP